MNRVPRDRSQVLDSGAASRQRISAYRISHLPVSFGDIVGVRRNLLNAAIQLLIVLTACGCAPQSAQVEVPLVSVSRTRGNNAYVHLASSNWMWAVRAWSISEARYESPSQSCAAALDQDVARNGDVRAPVSLPEFSLGVVSTQEENHWQVRTIGVPGDILGKDCILKLTISTKDSNGRFADRQLAVPLRAGFFQSAVGLDELREAAQFSAAGIAEYFVDYRALVIRILVKMSAGGLFEVSWPGYVRCDQDGVKTYLPWERKALTNLPDEGKQVLADGQWASAAGAFWTSWDGTKSMDNCFADVEILYFSDESDRPSKTSLAVPLHGAAKARSSNIIWDGCPACNVGAH